MPPDAGLVGVVRLFPSAATCGGEFFLCGSWQRQKIGIWLRGGTKVCLRVSFIEKGELKRESLEK